MKYKSDANPIRHQKNLLYVKIKAFHCLLHSPSPHLLPSSYLPPFIAHFGPSSIKLITLNARTCLLASVHSKRNKQYKHFIFNTIVKPISNPIYTASDKHLPSRSLRHWLRALSSLDSLPASLSTFPHQHPRFFYFSFTPSLRSNSFSSPSFTAPISSSSVTTSNSTNAVITSDCLLGLRPSCWFLDLFHLRPLSSSFFFDSGFQAPNLHDVHVPFHHFNLLPHLLSSSLGSAPSPSGFADFIDHNLSP